MVQLPVLHYCFFLVTDNNTATLKYQVANFVRLSPYSVKLLVQCFVESGRRWPSPWGIRRLVRRCMSWVGGQRGKWGLRSCHQEGHRATGSCCFAGQDMAANDARQVVARAGAEGRCLACCRQEQPHAGVGLGVWGPLRAVTALLVVHCQPSRMLSSSRSLFCSEGPTGVPRCWAAG